MATGFLAFSGLTFDQIFDVAQIRCAAPVTPHPAPTAIPRSPFTGLFGTKAWAQSSVTNSSVIFSILTFSPECRCRHHNARNATPSPIINVTKSMSPLERGMQTSLGLVSSF
ncbi:MAG: hypothetical protein WCK57_12005 [Verrucomicrobiae bacterium]